MKLFNEKITNVKQYQLKSLDSLKIFLFILAGFLTLGIFWLLSYWISDIYYLLFRNEQDIWKADYILIQNQSDEKQLIKIQRQKCRITPFKQKRYYLFFRFNGQMYYYNPKQEEIQILKDQILNNIMNDQTNIQDLQKGLDKQIVEDLRIIYGKNQLDIKRYSFSTKFLLEFLRPINFVQFIFGVGFYLLGMYFYATVIMIQIFINLYFITKEYDNSKRKLIELSKFEDQIKIKRRIKNDVFVDEYDVKELIIGDVVELEVDRMVPCDILLIEGVCLVNEALLTGESIPISKSQVDLKNKKDIYKSILFSGTKIIHKKSNKIQAIVLGTGWNTSKGKMLSSVVFGNVKVDQFEKDFIKFLFCITFVITIVMSTITYQEIKLNGFYLTGFLHKILDIAKSNFPPSLFFILTFSLQISSKNLEKKQIYSLASHKIVEGGAVKTICFDKTGTLTQLEIRAYGVVLRQGDYMLQEATNISCLKDKQLYDKLMIGISTCHSLEMIKDKVIGDPMEQNLFKISKSKMKEVPHPLMQLQNTNCIVIDDKEYVIYKVNQFTSERRCMSVVVKVNQFELYCKGAPEVIKLKCLPSTIPKNYDYILKEYTTKGFRVLSLAYKETVDNSQEKDMIFLGFLLFQNPLKKKTKEIIQELNDNYYETLMITGDNIFTAINVGYQCSILDKQSMWIGTWKQGYIQWQFQEYSVRNMDNRISEERIQHSMLSSKGNRIHKSENHSIQYILHECSQQDIKMALTGKSFQFLMEENSEEFEIMDQILSSCLIYARCSAKQKLKIVEKLKQKNQQSKKYVAFIGDGSNDSMALKSANVGISLGNNESSSSASFFTSKDDISVIKDLLIEGKVCLGNAIQNFKHYVSMNMIFVFEIFIMGFYGTDYVNFDYTIGGIVSFVIAYYSCSGKTREKLTFITIKPTVLCYEVVFEFLLQLLMSILICWGILHYIFSDSLRKPYDSITSTYSTQHFIINDYYFQESKILYFIHPLCSLSFAFVYYASLPFKYPIYTMFKFVCAISLVIFYHLFQTFPEKFLYKFPKLLALFTRIIKFPSYQDCFRYKVYLLAVLLISISTLIGLYFNKMRTIDLYRNKEKDQNKFKRNSLKNSTLYKQTLKDN